MDVKRVIILNESDVNNNELNTIMKEHGLSVLTLNDVAHFFSWIGGLKPSAVFISAELSTVTVDSVCSLIQERNSGDEDIPYYIFGGGPEMSSRADDLGAHRYFESLEDPAPVLKELTGVELITV